jgi:peptide/nickel transport system permease protein
MNDEETQRDIAEELKRGIWEHRKKEIEFTIYRIRKSPLSIIGIILISIFIIIALAAPLICPPNLPDPYRVPKTTSRLPLPPSREHPFGTAGPLTYIDIFYGVIWGTRLSLMLAFTITGVCFIIGLFIGTISGYFGGRVDEILMRITDLAYALPWLLIMLVVLVAIGKPGFWTMVIAYTSVAWSNYARVVRGEVLKIKNELYIEAAKAIGVSDIRIIVRHVIPNVIYSVLVMASLRMGWIVLTTSSLGFLGLGFRRGTAEWGIIISEGRDWILQGSWWITVYPGLFIFFFVLGWQLLGDAFRDILDPKVRRGL